VTALVVAEAALAVLLIPAGTARAAALGAAALFAMFAVVVAVARLRGCTPDCHCFGRLHSAPAGWPIVGRNAALAMAAAAIASQPPSVIGVPVAIAFGAAALVLVQSVLLIALLRRYGKTLRRVEELEAAIPPVKPLEPGAEAPIFDGLPARGRQALLVFTAPGCGPCEALLPRVAEWQRDLAHVLTVAVVEDAAVLDSYGIAVTPSAVLVSADGRVPYSPAEGAEAIERLVESLAPAPGTVETRSRNGRVALVGAAAGAVVAGAAVAQAAPPTDPELKAIDDLLATWGPRLQAAVLKSRNALRAEVIARTANQVRATRLNLRKALAAERREVLALRSKLATLSSTGAPAHNARMSATVSLTYWLQSLDKRRQAIGAQQEIALRLVKESEELFMRSLDSSVAAGRLLGRGG
jgi:thiol-disulfide isomerase/thioredoxin